MKKTKRLINLSFFLAMLFLIAGAGQLWATTFTATKDGNWSDATVWGSSVPTSEDDVNLSTYTITVDDDYTINSVTIGNGGVLQPKTTGTFTLTITGDITCTSATPNINGSNSNGILNIVIDNSTTKTITAGAANSIEFYNLTLTEGSAITINNGCKLEGDLVVNNNASFTQSAGTFTVFGTNSTLTNASLGTLTFFNLFFASTATNASTGSSFTVSRSLELASSAKFNASAGTISMNMSSAAALVAPININSTASDLTFYNVTFTTPASGTFKPATSFTIAGNMTKAGAGDFYPTAGTVEFDNSASKNDPKTITLSAGNMNFFNLKVTDGSNVSTTGNFKIDGNGTGGNNLTILGTGSFVGSGTTTFYATASTVGVSVANGALLQLKDVSVAAGTAFYSTSNLVLTGDIATTTTSSATFASPSIVAFKDSLSTDHTITNLNTTNATFMFNDINVYDDANITSVSAAANSNTITVTGDINVYGNSSLNFSSQTGAGAVVLNGGTAKSFNNEGTLQFRNLYIENTTNNVLNTSSDFTITNDFHVLGTSASKGAINASGNSIITFSKAGDPFVGTTLAAHNFQSIKATGAMTAATAGNLLKIKGDLIVDGGSIDFATAGNASTITFAGTSQQKIIGDTRLDEVYIDNSNGLVLEGNLTLGKASAESSTLTITNGFVDLNGNYYIAFDNFGDALSESTGKVIKNTKPGTGYISTASSSYTDINASGIGISGLTNSSTNIVVKRYYGVKSIDGIEGITRYYHIAGDWLTGTDIRLAYDESELNSNTEAQLTAYMSGNPDAYSYSSDASTTTTSYHNWTHTSATVTATSNYLSMGVSSITGSSASFTTGGYFMIAPKFLKIAYFPTTSIDYQNKVAESPLAASSSNKTILGFSLTPTMRIDASAMRFTALNVNFSRSPSGIFSNFEIYKDANYDMSDYGYGSAIATGSLSGNTVQFSSLGQQFTAGRTEYYFIVADVDATVNSSTPSLYAYINQDGITMNNIYKKTQTITGTTYSFSALNTTLSSANSPSSGALDIGTSNQTLYGFKLKPPAGSSVTFNTVNIKITVANGAEYDDFENWELYVDNNKNGIYDGDDVQAGSTISSIDETTGILSYTVSGSLVAGEENNYILIADVKTDANADGTLKAKISSNSDVTLASPATVPSGGPYEGNTMTVRSSSGTATRLSITAFSMKDINGNSGRDYDLKAKGENEVVKDESLVIQVKTVDANGRPQKIDQATTLTLTPLGGGTVTNNTLSMSINTTTVKGETLTFSTASTSGKFSLIASTSSGMSLTADTLTDITVYSVEPTSFYTGTAISSIQATTATIGWTNGSAEKVLVVIKASDWPTNPEDGVDYNSTTNVSSPASSDGTTGTGSVVVYEGTGSSVNITGLSANTTYYVKVFKYLGSGIGSNYLTWDVNPGGTYNGFADRAQFTTKYSAPTSSSTNLTFTSLTASSMKLTWTKPSSGGGTYSLVVVGTADPTTTPTDTVTYTANTTYADGSPLGTGSAVGYVVYAGDGNSVTVSGLSYNTKYYVRVYEFNGSSAKENYLTTQNLSGNRTILDKEPEIQANNISFSGMTLGTNTSIRVNLIRGNGDKVLVVGKVGSAITANETPTDQSVVYTSETSQSPTFGTTTAIGQGYVLYLGTANTINVSGLQYGQTYYFKAFEYNEGAGGNTTTDNSVLNYNTDDATDNPNSRIADSYEPNDALANSKFVNSDGTLYTGIISSGSDADWFSFRPDFENSYKNIRIKLTGLPQNYTIELYRADGRLLRRSILSGTSDETLILNNLPEADYYVKIYSADGEYSLTPYRVNILNRTTDYKADTQ